MRRLLLPSGRALLLPLLSWALAACGSTPGTGDGGDSAVSTDATPTADVRETDATMPSDAPALDGATPDGTTPDVQSPPDAGACSHSTTFDIAVPLALSSTTVHAGQALSGSVTYRNCTSAPFLVQEIVIAARPPGGTHAGGPYVDLAPTQGPITVAAGATVSLTAMRDFTAADPVGSYVSYATYQDTGGTWHDGPEVGFTVTSTTTSDGTYPMGVALRGINRAGMEYGDDWDGWTGQSYYEVPTASQTTNELAYFRSRGFNVIRLPISWERLQHTLGGPLDTAYSAGMMGYINAATGQGFHVVLDLHNYNRYAVGAFNASGAQVATYTQHVLGDGTLTVTHLRDVWVTLVGLVGSNPRVILNLMNEPHDFPMDSTAWFGAVQMVMNAIRAAGSTQLILVPNSRASDVTHWSTYSPNGGPLDSVAALAITDGANNYAFDMHAYQDNPGSSTSYANLMSEVTTWARSHGRRLFLSELGSDASATNGAAGVGGLLTDLNTNSDVWMGWTPWDLAPYALTTGTHTADAPPMAWYTPFLTPNFLGP